MPCFRHFYSLYVCQRAILQEKTAGTNFRPGASKFCHGDWRCWLVSAGIESHSCLSETQMCSVGKIPSNWLNEPSAMAMASGLLLRSAKIWLPQRGQNLRIRSSLEANSVTVPVMRTWSFRNSARTKKADPVSCWQSRQWHARTLIGGPVTTNFTAPQKHCPVRTNGDCSLMPFK